MYYDPDPDLNYHITTAAKYGKAVALKKIIKGGYYDINYKDQIGMTSFSYACQNEYIECAKILLDAGANIYTTDNLKQCALDVATYHGHIKIIKFIKEQMIKDFKFLPLCNDIVRHIIMEYI